MTALGLRRAHRSPSQHCWGIAHHSPSQRCWGTARHTRGIARRVAWEFRWGIPHRSASHQIAAKTCALATAWLAQLPRATSCMSAAAAQAAPIRAPMAQQALGGPQGEAAQAAVLRAEQAPARQALQRQGQAGQAARAAVVAALVLLAARAGIWPTLCKSCRDRPSVPLGAGTSRHRGALGLGIPAARNCTNMAFKHCTLGGDQEVSRRNTRWITAAKNSKCRP